MHKKYIYHRDHGEHGEYGGKALQIFIIIGRRNSTSFTGVDQASARLADSKSFEMRVLIESAFKRSIPCNDKSRWNTLRYSTLRLWVSQTGNSLHRLKAME